jgi:hypothetical protein
LSFFNNLPKVDIRQKFAQSGHFSPIGLCKFNTKWVGLHFGRFFHKPFWNNHPTKNPSFSSKFSDVFGDGNISNLLLTQAMPPQQSLWTRVARFFLVPCTKTGENMPNYHKIYQMPIKVYQMAVKKQMSIKYTLQRPSKIYQNCEFWSENIPSGNPVVGKGL